MYLLINCKQKISAVSMFNRFHVVVHLASFLHITRINRKQHTGQTENKVFILKTTTSEALS